MNVFGRKIQDVCCMVGDNCSTNKSIAAKGGICFNECASHRLNLAAGDCVESYKPLLYDMEIIMRLLRGLIPIAKLRKHTHLCAFLEKDVFVVHVSDTRSVYGY